jgi:cytochrome c553
MQKSVILSLVVAIILTGCSEENSRSTTVDEALKNTTKKVEDTPKDMPKDIQEPQNIDKKELDQKAEPKQVKTDISSNKDGQVLYQSCSACHGLNGEKKALGVSEVILGWSKDRVELALKGYKDGTYKDSKTMKNVMAAQARKLTDDEIKTVSKYIGSLK